MHNTFHLSRRLATLTVALMVSLASMAQQKKTLRFTRDFDRDGTTETYEVVGTLEHDEEYDVDVYVGRIFYQNGNSPRRLVVDKARIANPNIITFSKRDVFSYNVCHTTAISTIFIDQGNCIDVGTGGMEVHGDQLRMIASELNASGDKTGLYYGRTENPYWGYVDQSGVHEYGGVEIDETQLMRFDGAEKVLEKILAQLPEFTRFEDAIYRANGIVNINLVKVNADEDGTFDCYHYNARYDMSTRHLFLPSQALDEENTGHYRPAYNEKIAVTPELPKWLRWE